MKNAKLNIMSKSLLKTEIQKIVPEVSEKIDKRRWNRIFRRRTKVCLLKGAEPPLRLRAVCNVWDGAKDGKRYKGM